MTPANTVFSDILILLAVVASRMSGNVVKSPEREAKGL